MKWENRYNLSDRVIRVLKGKYKDHRPELNRLSITDLIDDPLPRILFINHWDDIVRDYSDLITMVQGIALHSRYEECASESADVEHKFEDVINGVIVVGKADWYEEPLLLELKQTGVYGPKYRLKKWTKQMNCYAWQKRVRRLASRAGGIEEVTELGVDIWYRDWKQGNTYWRDYPPIPYEYIRLDLWDFETQDKYIRSQVKKHLACVPCERPDQYEKPCSDKQRGIRWEAYKGKNKTPTKVGDTYDEVNQWCQQQLYKFDIRKSEPVFCHRYCRARSICPFSGVKE
jgi:hypothetical protein